MSAIKLEIVSAEKAIFSGEAAMIVAPGKDGDLGIAPKHTPLLTTLRPGEIEIHSDCLCDQYWGEPERWRNAFTTDGYFRSGDLGRLDEHQNLIYLGRINESFESGGLMIFPAEIENVIFELSGIDDCVVFGLPDAIFGHLVSVAFVASDNLTKREIIEHARARLPKHMWPTRLFKEKEFPKLSSGKTDRRKLGFKFIL